MKIDGINADKAYSSNEIASRVFKDYGVNNAPKAFMISPEGKILEIFEWNVPVKTWRIINWIFLSD